MFAQGYVVPFLLSGLQVSVIYGIFTIEVFEGEGKEQKQKLGRFGARGR